MPHEYSKSQLDGMGITDLKKIGSRYKIYGFSTYSSANKQELADKIFARLKEIDPDNFGQFPDSKIMGPPQPVQPKIIPVVIPKLTPKIIPKLTPRDESPTPPSSPGSDSSNGSISKPKGPINLKKIDFGFKEETDIMPGIRVILERLPSFGDEDDKTPDPDDPNDVTPEILLDLISTESFCRKVAISLRDIYKVKEEKYKKLEEKTAESIRLDKEEKIKMSGVVDAQDLDKMFPMISTNTALLIKLQTLRTLSMKKYKEFLTVDRTVLKNIREKFTLAITDQEDGIISITGESRRSIRNQLCKQLFILSKGYRPFMDAFINMVFTGPAGVGKTKLAKTYGYVFQNSGILLKGELIVLSPKDMIAGYVGHTAIKTAGMLMKGLESVIFVDEAYQLMPCKDGKINEEASTFGPEAITEIVNFLDKNIGMTIMIVAGYQREIEGCFFAANQGLKRRFPININVPKYSNSDLLNIFLNETVKRIGENIFDEETARYIYTLIVKLDSEELSIFNSQAGDMMNLSSMFLQTYYSSYIYEWGNLEDDIKIIKTTFNLFLQNKGYKMTIS